MFLFLIIYTKKVAKNPIISEKWVFPEENVEKQLENLFLINHSNALETAQVTRIPIKFKTML